MQNKLLKCLAWLHAAKTCGKIYIVRDNKIVLYVFEGFNEKLMPKLCEMKVFTSPVPFNS